MAETQQAQTNNNQSYLGLQRIYVKDMSFETPGAPDVFRRDWKPEINLDLNTRSQVLEKNIYEVELKVTVNAKDGDKTVFVAEVMQAGIFAIEGYNDEQMDQIVNIYCPTVLYPYARQVITNMVTEGSFPQLLLAPINFEALYAQHKQQQTDQTTDKTKVN